MPEKSASGSSSASASASSSSSSSRHTNTLSGGGGGGYKGSLGGSEGAGKIKGDGADGHGRLD